MSDYRLLGASGLLVGCNGNNLQNKICKKFVVSENMTKSAKTSWVGTKFLNQSMNCVGYRTPKTFGKLLIILE